MMKLPCSEERILQVARTTLTSATNNLSGLSRFGWTEEDLHEFSLKIAETTALGDFAYTRTFLKGMTVEKEDVHKECYDWLSDLRVRIKQVFKKDSPEIQSIPFRKLYRARNSSRQMPSIMEMMLDFSKAHQNELLKAGHSSEIYDKGVALMKSLSDKDTKQGLKKKSNESETQIRHLKFTEIYETVNKINSAGRRAFKDQPEKKVLFASKWRRKSKAQKKKKNRKSGKEKKGPLSWEI